MKLLCQFSDLEISNLLNKSSILLSQATNFEDCINNEFNKYKKGLFEEAKSNNNTNKVRNKITNSNYKIYGPYLVYELQNNLFANLNSFLRSNWNNFEQRRKQHGYACTCVDTMFDLIKTKVKLYIVFFKVYITL